MEGHNYHCTTVSTRITIAANPSELFNYLTNLKNHYLWNPQTRKISNQGILKLGTKFTTESQVLGTTVKAHNVVTKIIPAQELVIENRIGIVMYKGRFVLKEARDETLVTLSTTLTIQGSVWAFTLPVLRQLAVRELRTDLQALKVSIENGIAG